MFCSLFFLLKTIQIILIHFCKNSFILNNSTHKILENLTFFSIQFTKFFDLLLRRCLNLFLLYFDKKYNFSFFKSYLIKGNTTGLNLI